MARKRKKPLTARHRQNISRSLINSSKLKGKNPKNLQEIVDILGIKTPQYVLDRRNRVDSLKKILGTKTSKINKTTQRQLPLLKRQSGSKDIFIPAIKKQK